MKINIIITGKCYPSRLSNFILKLYETLNRGILKTFMKHSDKQLFSNIIVGGKNDSLIPWIFHG